MISLYARAAERIISQCQRSPVSHCRAVSAFARYWEDIIEPPVVVCPKGTITPPEKPGIGFEVKENLIETLAVKRESLSFN